MANVTQHTWGVHQGKNVYLFHMEGDGIQATVTNYGAILQSLIVRDRAGSLVDIVLGYDELKDYLTDPYFFGANVGPIADRLAGGSCLLDGRRVQFSLNAGPDSMHSGSSGFHLKVWDWRILSNGVEFFRNFCEDQSGFPGKLYVSITYTIDEPGQLRISYSASCEKETALNFTNHSYFNLDGAVNDCLRHTLWVSAEHYAETTCTEEPLVTGKLLKVEDTEMDLRQPVSILDPVSKTNNQEIASAGGLDHFYVVDGEGFRKFAELASESSGLRMECLSDSFGIQVYSGNGIKNTIGKNGMHYEKNWGICLETGNIPNAVNMDGFRDNVLLKSGEIYNSTTVYKITEK